MDKKNDVLYIWDFVEVLDIIDIVEVLEFVEVVKVFKVLEVLAAASTVSSTLSRVHWLLAKDTEGDKDRVEYSRKCV